MQTYIVLNTQACPCPQPLGAVLQQCAPEARILTLSSAQQVNETLRHTPVHVLFIYIKDWNYTLFCDVPVHQRPLLVFISEANEKGTELLARDLSLYLKEPFCSRAICRLLQGIEQGKHRVQPHWNFFFIKHNYRYKKIAFSQVACIEAKTNYSTISTPEQQFTIACSLNKLMAQLPGQQFCRVNRHLVLPRHSMNLLQSGCLQYEGKKISLSRKRKKEWASRQEQVAVAV